MEDQNEDYCEGDPPIEDIDWDQVAELESRQTAVLAVPEEDRPVEMLGLLHEMYGDDLEVW